MIQKLALRNYRRFREFDLEFESGLNVLVGRNDSGKSTVIEALSVALTGRIHGRAISHGISPYLINLDATREYVEGIRQGKPASPPVLLIDLFLHATDQTEPLRGTNNVHAEDACGLRVQARLSDDYAEEYANFIRAPESVRLAPTEYYRLDWLGFSGNPVSARNIPATASVVDPATIRFLSGVEHHLQSAIRTHLDVRERVELSRQYRSLREEFGEKDAVKRVNERLNDDEHPITDRELKIAIDISPGFSWESSLVAHIDDVPFQLVGRGEQNSVKTLLALGTDSSEAKVILIEEPETHLTFASLRRLVSRIEQRCAGKQVVVATHSAYVINKLGLGSLILLGGESPTRITDLPNGTSSFFSKLPGFDTLRLVLADGAVLVEGPSDELIIQRAYLDQKGRLPIEDGIDVISVGTSHKRFLELAVRLRRRVCAVVDNDGSSEDLIRARFADFLGYDFVSLHVGADPELPTLEPQIVAANDVGTMNRILGLNLATPKELVSAMSKDKTAHALSIFSSPERIRMPRYIRDVVDAIG